MRRLRVHVLPESGGERLTYCSGHIRLLRPLSHPAVAERIELSSGRSFDGRRCDVVIVERLWRPDLDEGMLDRLFADVRRAGARLIYAQDDNILDLHQGLAGSEWLTTRHIALMERIQREAAGIIVSTEPLRRRLASYNQRLVVVPNALDERLLPAPPRGRPKDGPLVVGYMGTRSHDQDLEMIAPALEAAQARYGDRLALEIVGVLAHKHRRGLRLREIAPLPQESDYPMFMLWFGGNIRWDIGLAPLRRNVYNDCKSDIKWLDYTSVGTTGLYSQAPAYDGLRHKETGYLVENTPEAWREGLLELLSDQAMRQRIVATSSERLHAERTLARCATAWPDAIEQILAG